jgi:hypothetical protein
MASFPYARRTEEAQGEEYELVLRASNETLLAEVAVRLGTRACRP